MKKKEDKIALQDNVTIKSCDNIKEEKEPECIENNKDEFVYNEDKFNNFTSEINIKEEHTNNQAQIESPVNISVEEKEENDNPYLPGMDPSILSSLKPSSLFLSKKTYSSFIPLHKKNKRKIKEEKLFSFQEIESISRDKIFNPRRSQKDKAPSIKSEKHSKYSRCSLFQYSKMYLIREQLITPFIANNMMISSPLEKETNMKDTINEDLPIHPN